MPSYKETVRKLGYDFESDDINNDEVLFQQGFNTIEIEVNPGTEFTISQKFEQGYVSCEETKYKLIDKTLDNTDNELFLGGNEEEEDELFLYPGKYFFNGDGIIIEKLSDLYEEEEEEEEEVDDEYQNDFINTDTFEEKIFDKITDSAKARFDYSSFSSELNDYKENLAENILFTIISSLSVEEDVNIISLKLFNELLMCGLKWDLELIKQFVTDRKVDLQLEIFATNLAANMLHNGENPLTVLNAVNQILK